MTDNILPCPFCGGAPKLRMHRTGEDSMEAYVECPKCEVRTTYYEDAYAPTADAIGAWNRRATPPQTNMDGSFQSRVQPWMLACFGEMIAGDREERNHRFLEEALELVQSTGCTESEAHQLVDYVYGRAIGEPNQEVGGVMVTLAALCLANALDMHEAGETELARIWTKVEQIRAKQAAKPKHSPLPGPTIAEGQDNG